MLLMCHGAKDVAISANKLAGVRAVVCKDQEDAVEAVGYTRANVILIDTGRVPRNNLESIIEGLLSQKEEPVPAPIAASARRRQIEEAPARESRQQQQQQQPVYEPKGPGMFSGLKDKLGAMTQHQQKPIQAKAKPATQSSKGSIKDGAGDFVKSAKQKGLMKTLKETFGVEE